uniref:Uncharacterized protein n=1 Tax=Arundo donax TaxID=35708 RepID=A0A0A8ZWD6_ARUDO
MAGSMALATGGPPPRRRAPLCSAVERNKAEGERLGAGAARAIVK